MRRTREGRKFGMCKNAIIHRMMPHTHTRTLFSCHLFTCSAFQLWQTYIETLCDQQQHIERVNSVFASIPSETMEAATAKQQHHSGDFLQSAFVKVIVIEGKYDVCKHYQHAPFALGKYFRFTVRFCICFALEYSKILCSSMHDEKWETDGKWVTLRNWFR